MLFSSIPFLFYFLPCALFLYAITPRKWKNLTLLLVSLVFYAWGEPRLVILMMATVLCGYVLGLLTEKDPKHKKIYLTLAVLLALSFLGYYKYADFFIENINRVTGLSIPLLSVALPIGISFYTFQLVSYNIDVYRGKVPAQKNFINLAAYIALFPQLIAGPIVRYSTVCEQLENRTHSFEKIYLGTRRFIFGLAKKVLIANTLGEVCDIFLLSKEKSVLFFWLYAISFMLHIYFDFSGYSDMAIGLGKIFGFDFDENFNYPYIAKSITEFWRRWHISLGTWFRDYVYIPMGGSHVGKIRLFFNILTVWMLTGFWHGADWNFILWGLYFAVLLILEKNFFLKKLEGSRVFSRVYVLFFVLISFVIFNGATLSDAFSQIGGLFGIGGFPLVSKEAVFCLKNYAFVLLIAAVGATPFPKTFAEKYGWTRLLTPAITLLLLVLVTAHLVSGSFNPFLYFRF